MGWRDLLLTKDVAGVVLPWIGGRQIQWGQRVWRVDGQLPPEHGWYEFKNAGATLFLSRKVDPQPETLVVSGMAGTIGTKRQAVVKGYLVGDRLVPDTIRADEDPVQLATAWNTIHLLDEDLGRFARVQAGRAFENGPLIFVQQEMPTGPEDEVTRAFEDKATNITAIKGVSPALEAAFRFEVWRRDEAEKRRQELAKRRREEEEKRAQEQRRAAIAKQIGTAEGRRQMAALDFGEAAKAALRISNAEYLDHRSVGRGNREFAVKFRFMERRFECVCDANLRIVEAGICLTDHATGERGDESLTLESLSAVIKEAINSRQLHVFRHVDDINDDRIDDDD